MELIFYIGIIQCLSWYFLGSQDGVKCRNIPINLIVTNGDEKGEDISTAREGETVDPVPCDAYTQTDTCIRNKNCKIM